MKKGYSLMEVIMVVVVGLIIATFTLVGYRQLLENARQRVCSTNLKALGAAVEVYALENDVLPATLGDLKLEHLLKGYAKAIDNRDWFTKFSYFFIKINTPPDVYAQFLTPENLKKYGVTPEIFRCPADTNGPPSYGINANLAGKKLEDIPEGEVVIADCDHYTFTSSEQLSFRHFSKFGSKKFAQGVKKRKEKGKGLSKKVDKIHGGRSRGHRGGHFRGHRGGHFRGHRGGHFRGPRGDSSRGYRGGGPRGPRGGGSRGHHGDDFRGHHGDDFRGPRGDDFRGPRGDGSRGHHGDDFEDEEDEED
ncbi:MAG: prepilin-type N-terminal cleavage/methylation domain-containing protein [Candidatus Omnitrophica bacterium]|nr:prepilin-type N-terminal cleavage/methylation domain-containing protein [Candidatus Omnitrophota bacterium]